MTPETGKILSEHIPFFKEKIIHGHPLRKLNVPLYLCQGQTMHANFNVWICIEMHAMTANHTNHAMVAMVF